MLLHLMFNFRISQDDEKLSLRGMNKWEKEDYILLNVSSLVKKYENVEKIS